MNTPWINYKVMQEVTSKQTHEKKFSICYSFNDNGKKASHKNTKKKRKCSCKLNYLSDQFLGYPLDWINHLYENDWCYDAKYDEQCWAAHDSIYDNVDENGERKDDTHTHFCDNDHPTNNEEEEGKMQAPSCNDHLNDKCLRLPNLSDNPETGIEIENDEQKTNIHQDNFEKADIANTDNEIHSPITKQWNELPLAIETDQNNEADLQTNLKQPEELVNQQSAFFPAYDDIVEAKLAQETGENGVEIDFSDFYTVRQWKDAKTQDDTEMSSKADSNLVDYRDHLNNELTLTPFPPDDNLNENTIVENEQHIDLDNQVPLTFVNEDEIEDAIDEKQQINMKDDVAKDEKPFKQPAAQGSSESNQMNEEEEPLKEMRPPNKQIMHDKHASESAQTNRKNTFSDQTKEPPSQISTNEQDDTSNQINNGSKVQCGGDVLLVKKKIPFSFFVDIKQFLHPPIFGSADQQMYAFIHQKNNLSPDLKTKLFQTMISYTNQPYCKLINANIHELIFFHHQDSKNAKKKTNLLQQPIVTPLFSPFDSNKKSCSYRVKIPVVLGEYNLEVCLEEETTFPQNIIEIKQVFNEMLLTGCKFVPSDLSFINHGRMTTTEGKLFLQGYLLQHIEYVASEHHNSTEKKQKHETTHLGQKIVLNFVIELIQIQQIFI